MFKKILTALAILLFSSSSVLAQKTIVFAVPATVPPMAFVAEDGQLAGYSVDYIKAVAEAAGFTPVLKNIPWSGIFSGLVDGEFDAIIGAISITEKRKKVVDFTEPYFHAWQALAVPRKSSVKNLSDLKGEKVGGKLGSTGFFTIQNTPDITYEGYSEVSSLMEALNDGQVAAIVFDHPQVAHYIKTQYQDSLKIVAMVDTANKDDYAIAVKKDNSAILDLLNKGIRAVQDSSLDKKIDQKWLDHN